MVSSFSFAASRQVAEPVTREVIVNQTILYRRLQYSSKRLTGRLFYLWRHGSGYFAINTYYISVFRQIKILL